MLLLYLGKLKFTFGENCMHCALKNEFYFISFNWSKLTDLHNSFTPEKRMNYKKITSILKAHLFTSRTLSVCENSQFYGGVGWQRPVNTICCPSFVYKFCPQLSQIISIQLQ